MQMMNELKPLFLYSAKRKVYVPIDEKDKRRNSAILLLTPTLESSNTLMTLPYLYNPNLFTSFYIDRNVYAYINNVGIENIDFDEEQEAELSEAMVYAMINDTKFKFDSKTSYMDKKWIEDENVFTKNTVKYYARLLGISRIPDSISIIVHPTITSLITNGISFTKPYECYSYYNYKTNTIHVLSKTVYDANVMRGEYRTYLLSELLYTLIRSFNPDIPYVMATAIAYREAGLIDYISKNNNSISSEIGNIKFAKTVDTIIKRDGYDIIRNYIKTADIHLFEKYALSHAFKKVIIESELSYSDRQKLKDSDFGIPEKRKYPLHDKNHVLSAIRFFNSCDSEDEEKLAKAIIKQMKEFNMTDVNVGTSNRFKKYYKPDTLTEAAAEELLKEKEWDYVNKICNSLTPNELSRITFTDEYRNSDFVIKRFVATTKGDNSKAVGFLDVYQFPSKPSIAQVVIAVNPEFRRLGAADSLVKAMLKSGLEKEYGFDMYYWTAHEDNLASQNLAMKNGFIDTTEVDKHGRKIFIHRMNHKVDEIAKEIESVGEAGYYKDDVSFITEDAAIFFEADDAKYSQKLRKYLYSERMRNNKSVLVMYDKIKTMNPNIKRTYLKLSMYRKLNIFVDLSYYHSLFLKNNIYKLDKAVNMYFDFLNRLMTDKEITDEYSKITIFIPVDNGVWPIAPDTDIYDYKHNLNPISSIFRLLRTNPDILKKAWGNKTIVFTSVRGYFTVDFSKFELKNLPRFKVNIRKLMSTTEPIIDEYETDLEEDNTNGEMNKKKTADSSKAIAAKIIDRIESNSDIKIDNVSAIGSKITRQADRDLILTPHLRIVSNIPLNKQAINHDNGIVILSIDPDGPNGFKRLSTTPLSSIGSVISTYCLPK